MSELLVPSLMCSSIRPTCLVLHMEAQQMVGDALCYEAVAVCNAVLIETSILQQNPTVEQHCKFGQRLQIKSTPGNYIWEQLSCKSLYDP